MTPQKPMTNKLSPQERLMFGGSSWSNGNEKRTMTNKTKASIIKLYKMGWSVLAISGLKGMGNETVRTVLKEEGIVLRNSFCNFFH